VDAEDVQLYGTNPPLIISCLSPQEPPSFFPSWVAKMAETMQPSQRNRQIPIVCPGHSRPLAGLCFSAVTPDGIFLIR
jgi:hypothetical protein